LFLAQLEENSREFQHISQNVKKWLGKSGNANRQRQIGENWQKQLRSEF